MKFLCIILSIYVMLISSVACQDGFVLEDSKSSIVLSQDTDHAETPSDLCSPFCTCTCCVGFTQPSISQNTPLVNVIMNITYSYNENKNSSIPYPLFQPPRV